jgi:hypothetical protein
MEREELRLRERLTKLLETYTLEEILEHNDLEPIEVLLLLYQQGYSFPVDPC